MSIKKLKDQLLTLLDDYRDFNSSPITVQPIPTAIEFAKQVSRGYPCIYQAYTKTKDEQSNIHVNVDPSLLEYPAFNWTKQDLLNLIDVEVEVAVTPTGRADDLHHVNGEYEPIFLAPAAIDMTIEELLDKLTLSNQSLPAPRQTPTNTSPNPSQSPVYYLQSQNSNLTTTPLRNLHKHIPPSFPFADPVLSAPEATNIWIGTQHSTTSLHRDPYENLYLVLKGSKTFTLYPPVDELTLPVVHVRTGRYVYDPVEGAFSVVLDGDQVDMNGDVNPDTGDEIRELNSGSSVPSRIPWISIDPSQHRDKLVAQHDMYAHSSPRVVNVKEGQILYLPSGWYHHVVQSCGTWDESGSVAPCIAVNYWYDMEYEGEKYVTRQLIGRLKEMIEEEGVGEGGRDVNGN